MDTIGLLNIPGHPQSWVTVVPVESVSATQRGLERLPDRYSVQTSYEVLHLDGTWRPWTRRDHGRWTWATEEEATAAARSALEDRPW